MSEEPFEGHSQRLNYSRDSSIIAIAFLSLFLTTSFVSNAQPPIRNDTRLALLSISYYIETANNSINSIRSLLRKDNYRNKITTLNNPANNELGFNLKNEILVALQPLLDKARKTNHSKFREVVDNLVSNPQENGLGSMQKYLPAAGIFSTVISLVGNLVINEKRITKEDLEEFVTRTQKYFLQYEKLNSINDHFGKRVSELLEKSEEAREDLKNFLIECIETMDVGIGKDELDALQVEIILQKYFDPQKLQLHDADDSSNLFPPDAATTVKFLTSHIKKLQKEFETVYFENYQELKNLLNSLKATIPGIDEQRLALTSAEIEKLYNESRQADQINLNIGLLEERMSNVCRLIHGR